MVDFVLVFESVDELVALQQTKSDWMDQSINDFDSRCILDQPWTFWATLPLSVSLLSESELEESRSIQVVSTETTFKTLKKKY